MTFYLEGVSSQPQADPKLRLLVTPAATNSHNASPPHLQILLSCPVLGEEGLKTESFLP